MNAIVLADRQRLSRAVRLLTGVGYADPARVNPGVALLCLAAAERLRPLGDPAPPTQLDSGQIAAAIAEALAIFATLSEDVLAEEAVLDAAHDARRAREFLLP